MSRLVEESDIDGTSPRLVTVNTTATLCESRLGLHRRTFLSIIPVTAGVTATVVLGDGPLAAGQGIPLVANQPFSQSDDANGQGVFQGVVQCITSANGQVAVTEVFER